MKRTATTFPRQRSPIITRKQPNWNGSSGFNDAKVICSSSQSNISRMHEIRITTVTGTAST
ncbi:hypothetical protein [Bacillus velezensis]|uniref:hypothetical protein n=1 Tax=Bacillus velezensis TaxID=492670 RepID=UPI003D023DAB